MKINLGDTLRTTRRLAWAVPGHGEIAIPAGTLGEILPWDPGCSIRFEGIEDHPITKYFPMVRHHLGQTDYPDSMELVARAGARHAA